MQVDTPIKKQSVRSKNTGAIFCDGIYPLPVFKKLTGLADWALRTARRSGLRMVQVGNRRFVRGSDWFDYLGTIEPMPVERGTKKQEENNP